MNTVAIYGNVVLDTIYEENTTKISLGGCINVIKAFSNHFNLYCQCCIHPDDYRYVFDYLGKLNAAPRLSFSQHRTSLAEIWCNVEQAQKHKSVVRWGACNDFVPKEQKADWHHFAYLDALPNLTLDDIPQNGIVSADLCKSEHSPAELNRILKIASNIDYLFLSDHEAPSIFWRTEHRNLAKKATIIHHDKGSELISNKGSFEISLERLKNLNVLGAGDTLVSFFIQNNLNGNSLLESIWQAHQQTTNFLVSR